MNSFKAICVARYHTLCFAAQQKIPFVIVSSNSHKSEALVEELGLPLDIFSMPASELGNMKERLRKAEEAFPEYEEKVAAFNSNAKTQINAMFDHITSLV
jgi:polysaccharide pyruvyl transferase WcaK-like protein